MRVSKTREALTAEMQNTSNKILCLALLAFVGLSSHVDAACNSCMPNNVACINETAFNMCYSDVRDESSTFNCPDTYVCTQLQAICMPRGQIEPACSLGANCNECDGSRPFVCINREQYAQCYGTVQTTNVGTCPTDTYCNTSTGQICVDDCTGPECDRVTAA